MWLAYRLTGNNQLRNSSPVTDLQFMIPDTGWVIWPVKIVPDMTYNVFGGTLNPTLLYSNYLNWHRWLWMAPNGRPQSYLKGNATLI